MKSQFVETLQEGDVVNDHFLAVHKDLRTQPNGAKFLGMVFKDRTGDIGGVLWQNAASVARMFEVGDVVNVRGTVTSYQQRLQIRVEQVLPLKDGEYNTADLVFAPANTEEILDGLGALLDTVENPWLRQLIDAFWGDKEFMEAFSKAAAGKKWHHAYPGGLAKHCYEVARIAHAVADLFPDLDREVLLTAVFLHDIGKIEEMRHELVVEYSTPGRLLGHLDIGASMLRERIGGIEGFPEDLKLQLLHCVLAHHGELANGSPVVPKTLEAIVLYHCDNLDAQADAAARIIGETRDKGQAWSEYVQLIERQFWVKGNG
ncbi:MAG TPA: HD domain-containing protein [Candidatus Hydrogenedentes bacterium]|nr:HD domain-containing protein [Candidatus Hydrogenedentota bacterium]HPG67129.1 HD domain-containing protein [Candidatus Hydrogenedentota bacterium]